MSEKHFRLTVLCLVCLGLTVNACGPHKSHLSQCQSYSKGHNQKSSCSQLDQYNFKAAENAMLSAKIHYPTPTVPISYGEPISNRNVYDAPRMIYSIPENVDGSIGIYATPYEYLRRVRSKGSNQLNNEVKGEVTLSYMHDLNPRDDIVRSRVRRNGEDAIAPRHTHDSIDPDTIPSWQDLIKFFQAGKASDSFDGQGKDDKSYERSQETDDLSQSHELSVTSDESSRSSIEFLERIRERLPYFFHRLQSLRRLISDSSSIEDVRYDDASNPFHADAYEDSASHFYETAITSQLKRSGGEATLENSMKAAASRDKMMTPSANRDDVENTPFTTPIVQDDEITTNKSLQN